MNQGNSGRGVSLHGIRIQLGAFGTTNILSSFNEINEDRYANENIEYEFINNKVHIQRTSDLMTPLYIYSDRPIEYLSIYIGGEQIINFPLTFCNTLLNIENEMNEYLYKLPWDLLKIKPIPLIALQYHTIDFKLITSYQCNAKLYTKQIFLENNARQRIVLRGEPISIHIKQFQEQQIQLDSNHHNYQLNFVGIIKGFFIDNINDIQEINNIEFLLNNATRFNYNKIMIRLFTKKISDRCIYIPLDEDDFNGLNNQGGLNCDRIEIISLRIDSNINQNVMIRALNVNVLRIESGIGGLVIPHSPNIPHSPEINKKIEGDIICAISLLHIQNENKYMTCTVCKKNFMEESLRKWLVKENNCPTCRSQWTENIIYINK